jgi:hypothetical protein
MEPMHKWTMAAATLGIALAIASGASAQPITAGGKYTQAAYDCEMFDANGQAVISVTVPKGIRKRILVMNAHARGIGGTTCELGLNADFATLDGFGGSTNGHQGGVDTATGSWWADIDELEIAAPGTYIGVPFPVVLNVSKTAASNCAGACVGFSVQVEKK